MRGFPELIEALPAVLEAHPTLKVEIAGEDRICYGGPAPKEGSYGEWAKKKLEPWITSGKVEFLGSLPPDVYPSWLRRSWMHVHLTRPFVASWSLLEAMAAGCCLIASNTEPVREFLDASNSALVDFRTEQWLNPVVTALLADQDLNLRLGAAAAVKAQQYDERHSIKAWGEILICQNANRAID